MGTGLKRGSFYIQTRLRLDWSNYFITYSMLMKSRSKNTCFETILDIYHPLYLELIDCFWKQNKLMSCSNSRANSTPSISLICKNSGTWKPQMLEKASSKKTAKKSWSELCVIFSHRGYHICCINRDTTERRSLGYSGVVWGDKPWCHTQLAQWRHATGLSVPETSRLV